MIIVFVIIIFRSPPFLSNNNNNVKRGAGGGRAGAALGRSITHKQSLVERYSGGCVDMETKLITICPRAVVVVVVLQKKPNPPLHHLLFEQLDLPHLLSCNLKWTPPCFFVQLDFTHLLNVAISNALVFFFLANQFSIFDRFLALPCVVNLVLLLKKRSIKRERQN